MQNFKWRGRSKVFEISNLQNPDAWRGKSDTFHVMDLRGPNFTSTISDGLHLIANEISGIFPLEKDQWLSEVLQKHPS